MNSRIQVEHTVTAVITGRNLVQAKIRIAEGVRLAEIGIPDQKAIETRGYAIQCRITTEELPVGAGELREGIKPIHPVIVRRRARLRERRPLRRVAHPAAEGRRRVERCPSGPAPSKALTPVKLPSPVPHDCQVRRCGSAECPTTRRCSAADPFQLQ